MGIPDAQVVESDKNMDKSGRVSLRLNQHEQTLLKKCITSYEEKLKVAGIIQPNITEKTIFSEALMHYVDSKLDA